MPTNGSKRATAAAGAVLVLIGLLSLLDRSIGTGWLPLAGLFVAGLVFVEEGYRSRHFVAVTIGILLSFACLGGLLARQMFSESSIFVQLGIFFLAFAVGWGCVWLFSLRLARRPNWWAFVPAGILLSMAVCYLFTPAGIFEQTLFLLCGTGAGLLTWGLGARLFGLIIPGCLCLTVGPGIYYAWGYPQPDMNVLAKTGSMLVIFAFGWGLIVLFSKRITEGFVWWPLIPGGVLAVVGWGLYIAGSPGSAMSFITNTGSVGLIIFGLYLMLLRRGLHR